MKIGTKSLLFGVHQFLIHPVFVLWGWCKLYGRPNWKELVCIIIHDWGYLGCADMDGKEGINHPVKVAKWTHLYLDKGTEEEWRQGILRNYGVMCFCHSAAISCRLYLLPSKLCWADKYATILIPDWLWVFLARLTGELDEYMNYNHEQNKKLDALTCPYEWKRGVSKLIMARIVKNVL